MMRSKQVSLAEEISTLRSTRRGPETWHGRNAVTPSTRGVTPQEAIAVAQAPYDINLRTALNPSCLCPSQGAVNDLELQAQVAAQSITAAALTLDAHLEKLLELRDKADQRGQTSAAIGAEELRGQLKRFYVKQVESGDAGDFSRMTIEELRAYAYGDELPPKGPKGPVKH
jgi:hypothetical protein